jgi:hypothetical protein
MRKAASKATISRCEMGMEYLKLEPEDRQQGPHVYAFAVQLRSPSLGFALFFFLKKTFIPFTWQKRLSWAASDVQFSC